MALEQTRALISALAGALGLASLPQGDDGGWQLAVGGVTDVLLYGGDDVTLLVVAAVASLPRDLDRGLVSWLLRNNLFDAATAPFVTAVDDDGALVFWGRLRIADIDGATLATVIDRVAEHVEMMRAEIGGTAPGQLIRPAAR